MEEWYLCTIAMMHCLFFPQVLKSAIYNHKEAIKPVVYLTIGVGRLSLLVYIFGCPKNFLVWKPKYWYAIFVAVLMLLQIGFLLIQSHLGPRFMLPRRFKPQAYSYFKPLNEEIELRESRDCSICLSELERQDRHIMTTPCSHSFHKNCLTNWMTIKLQCPTCRSELPTIED
mmetsp:Transcript_34367/g.60234  ORF Transcript_34367/g.60234 Transcript_34367/m.60234 type:complete len:172 (+) Transcript_34367:911-1426(+)